MENFSETKNHATPVVSVTDLLICRSRRIVISEFSLTVNPGDFLVLIGANGSGKTTILKALMGFVPFQRGTVSLFSNKTARFRDACKRIGYVPQNIPVDFRMPISVKEVVAMGRLGRTGLGRRFSRRDNELVSVALKDVGLEHLASRPFGHLSGGERQKAHIARALCGQPALLLLDEPTSNLDLGAQRDCLDLLSEIHSKYALTTIIVMHDLASLPVQCNRAVVIDNSKKVFDGPFTDVFTESNLKHVYKGRTQRVLQELLKELSGGTGNQHARTF